MKRMHFEKEERAIPDQSERGIDFRSQGAWLDENFAEEPTMIRLRGLQVIVSLSNPKLRHYPNFKLTHYPTSETKCPNHY